MNIQAEASFYPLRRDSLAEPIDSFVQYLRQCGLSVTVGSMSSHISGECGSVFRGLGKAFEDAAHGGDVVLTVKVSNACPRGVDNSRDSEGNSPD